MGHRLRLIAHIARVLPNPRRRCWTAAPLLVQERSAVDENGPIDGAVPDNASPTRLLMDIASGTRYLLPHPKSLSGHVFQTEQSLYFLESNTLHLVTGLPLFEIIMFTSLSEHFMQQA